MDASGESIAANVQGIDEGGPMSPFPFFDDQDPNHFASTLQYERKRRAMLKARNDVRNARSVLRVLKPMSPARLQLA